ncbi:MAG: hypothetical protein ACJ72W_28240 [Actinoallomurus sp.]
MEDRLLVGGLRSGDPGAIGAVYDAYADRLFDYCWFQLRNREAAQLALRDALLAAEAHVGELRNPERFGLWLYALGRIECRRRRSPGPLLPDLPIARHDQDDVDLRVIAWRAITGLPLLSQELLDLRHRHAFVPADIAGVVGLPAREVTDLLRQANALLEAAVVAEIIAHEDPFECDGRAAILRDRRGELGDDQREALVCHAMQCDACAAHLPRTVSIAKVCALLPHAVPPASLREQVTSCFTDPRLAGYRLFAAARLRGFGRRGFPAQQGPGRAPAPARDTRWPRGLMAVTGAVCTAVGIATVCQWLGQDTHHTHAISGGGVAAPPGRVPSPRLIGPPAVGRPVGATFALGPRDRAGAPSALGPASPRPLAPAPGDGRLEVTPDRLVLGPGGTGSITLHSAGGWIQWQVTVTGAAAVRPQAGVLQPGGTATVSVRAGDGPGSAVIVFWPTGTRVTVTWSGPSSPPSRPPQPSPPSSSPPASPPPSTPVPPPSTQPPPSPPPSSPPPSSRPPEPPPTTAPAPHSDPPDHRPVPERQSAPARQPGPSAEGTG